MRAGDTRSCPAAVTGPVPPCAFAVFQTEADRFFPRQQHGEAMAGDMLLCVRLPRTSGRATVVYSSGRQKQVAKRC